MRRRQLWTKTRAPARTQPRWCPGLGPPSSGTEISSCRVGATPRDGRGQACGGAERDWLGLPDTTEMHWPEFRGAEPPYCSSS